MVTVLLLAGCFGRKSADKKDFTVEVCNDYIQYMRCVADSPNAPYTQELVNQLVDLWKTYPDDELQQACTVMLNDAVEKMKDIAPDCQLPTVVDMPAQEIETPELESEKTSSTNNNDLQSDEKIEITWEESKKNWEESKKNSPDRSVIDAISWKIDEPSASTNTDSSQSMRTSQEDAQIVSMVISEITQKDGQSSSKVSKDSTASIQN